MESHFIYTFKNDFFGFQNSVIAVGCRKKFFLVNFERLILKTVGNESVRFSGYADIEVNYKILQLDVLKEALFLHNLSCFE